MYESQATLLEIYLSYALLVFDKLYFNEIYLRLLH